MSSPTSSPAPSSPSPSEIPSSPGSSQDTQDSSFPDYSVWDEAAFARYGGLLYYHDPAKERSWWWKIGFRLRDPNRPRNQQAIWVCERCFNQRKPVAASRFVASTGKSVIKHLKEQHRIQEVSQTAEQTADQ